MGQYLTKTNSGIEKYFQVLHDCNKCAVTSESIFHEYLSFLTILCFSKEKQFNKGRYTLKRNIPKNNTLIQSDDIYDKIWLSLFNEDATTPFKDDYFKFDRKRNLIHGEEYFIDSIQKKGCEEDFVKLFDEILSHLCSEYSSSVSSAPKYFNKLIGLINIDKNKRIYFPYSGLCEYASHMIYSPQVYCDEPDPVMFAVGAMNMLVHGQNIDNVRRQDPKETILIDRPLLIDSRPETFDTIIVTPRFGGGDVTSGISEELAILDELPDFLSENGEMLALVPEGFAKSDGVIKEIRKKLVNKGFLSTIVCLHRDALGEQMKGSCEILFLNKDVKEEIRIIEGEKYLFNQSLSIKDLREAIEDKKEGIYVSHEDMNRHDYSFVPGDFEDLSLENIRFASSVCFKEIAKEKEDIVTIHQSVRLVSSDDMSEDPFNFKKKASEIRQTDVIDIPNIKAEETQCSRIEEQINQIEQELQSRRKELNSFEEERVTASSGLKGKVNAAIESDPYIIEQQKSIDDLENKGGIFKKRQRQKTIEDKKKNINARKLDIQIVEEHKWGDVVSDLRAKINDKNREIDGLEDEKQKLNNNLEDTKNHLQKLKNPILVRVDEPSLILGGWKPRLKFIYIEDASPENPIFVNPEYLFAYKIFNNKLGEISSPEEYVIYWLSKWRFQSYGTTDKLIRKEELEQIEVKIIENLDTSMAKRFLATQAKESYRFLFPYLEKSKLFEEQMSKFNDDYSNLRHDVINKLFYIPTSCKTSSEEITNIIKGFDNGLNPDTKEKLLKIQKMIEGIGNQVIEVKNMLKKFKLEVDDSLPDGSPTIIVRYLDNHLKNRSKSNQYQIIFDAEEDIEKAKVKINLDSFIKAVDNIINNAERHGFSETNRSDYFIKVHMYARNEKLFIDFMNNGTPAPEGLSSEQYGTRGFNCGKTGNTGLGGNYVKNMVERYQGKFEVNPNDISDPEIKFTLRMVFNTELS